MHAHLDDADEKRTDLQLKKLALWKLISLDTADEQSISKAAELHCIVSTNLLACGMA